MQGTRQTQIRDVNNLVLSQNVFAVVHHILNAAFIIPADLDAARIHDVQRDHIAALIEQLTRERFPMNQQGEQHHLVVIGA